jgi:hypothetical protein
VQVKGGTVRAIVVAFLAAAVGAHAQGPDSGAVPRHLAVARELVANTPAEENHYVLGAQQVTFPGDLFSRGYSVRADCSGFLLAIFERADYRTRSQMQFLPTGKSRTRPAAEDFVYSIESARGFRRIQKLEDIRPGDLIAHALIEREVGTTGHVFLVDSVPRPIAPRRPLVEGTRQFEIAVIDSNAELVGADDTRLALPGKQGLGRGTIRIYADADGELVGWARTFPKTNRFFSYTPRFPSDTKPRKAAVGRPLDSPI